MFLDASQQKRPADRTHALCRVLEPLMMDGHVDHAKANNHTSVVNSPGLEGTPKSFDSFVHNCLYAEESP